MNRLILIITIFTCLICTTTSYALQVGEAKPKIKVYSPHETQVVAYDARPELGIEITDINKSIKSMSTDLGIRIARCTLNWNLMETTEKEGLYDSTYLTQWDKFVDECKTQGIYLNIIISGTPTGVNSDNKKQACERLAKFTANMAAKYPSVIFWEISSNSDSSIFSDNGKNYAEMLKELYPALKTANPTAYLLCSNASKNNDFCRAIYESNARQYFDIISIYSDESTFTESGKQLQKLMTEYGDTDKPIWTTIAVTNETDNYEECFIANNKDNLYQKVFINQSQLNTDPNIYKWARDNQPNKAILTKPRSSTNLFIPTKTRMIPIGYDYKEVNGGVEILGVRVDTISPTKINLIHIGEPETLKPGQKQIVPQKKKSTAPEPDPFDI